MNCTSGFTHPDVASATSEPRSGATVVDDPVRAIGTGKITALPIAAVFSGFLISLSSPTRGR